MSAHPIRGKTIRFRFKDGPMAGKTYEHAFSGDGKVAYGAPGTTDKSPAVDFELAKIKDDVYAVSYLGKGGYTLTSILDFTSNKLVSFSSNEAGMQVQRGTFEVLDGRRRYPSRPAEAN